MLIFRISKNYDRSSSQCMLFKSCSINLSVTVILLFYLPLSFNSIIEYDEYRTCGEYISSRGFYHEDHYVTTKDGYILHLFRIVNHYALESLERDKLKPVLLQHGIMHSCSSFLFNSPGGDIIPWVDGQPPNVTGNNLGFVLANNGYDVWLGACRGDTYSQKHVYLNPKRDPRFWVFTVDEIAKYDTPAEIDYIRKVTGKERIGYIGHSQGALQILLLLSIQPHYSEKVGPVILLAPAAFFGYVKGTFAALPDEEILLEIASLHPGPTSNSGPVFDVFNDVVCDNPTTNGLCEAFLNLFAGPDSPQLNKSRIGVYQNQQTVTAWSNFINFIRYKRLNWPRFNDYGHILNQVKYGSKVPPLYPYQNINSNCLALISGLNDYAADPQDVQQLRSVLRVKPLHDHIIPYPDWNHLDFIYALESYKYLTPIVLKILEQGCPPNNQKDEQIRKGFKIKHLKSKGKKYLSPNKITSQTLIHLRNGFRF